MAKIGKILKQRCYRIYLIDQYLDWDYMCKHEIGKEKVSKTQ